MPLIVPGSMQIGPRPSGSSAPATLPEYLASIGKGSWYGGFRAGLQQFSDFDNLVPVTADGASVRNWLANWSAGGFSASWGQSTGSRRPAYGTSRNGKPGIYGDGTDWYMTLNSPTALDRTHTVLLSTWTSVFVYGRFYSHGANNSSFQCPNNTTTQPTFLINGTTGGVTQNTVLEQTAVSGSTSAHRCGWSTVGTGFYGSAPTLFRSTAGIVYTANTIHEIWLIGAELTPREISAALSYLI